MKTLDTTLLASFALLASGCGEQNIEEKNEVGQQPVQQAIEVNPHETSSELDRLLINEGTTDKHQILLAKYFTAAQFSDPVGLCYHPPVTKTLEEKTVCSTPIGEIELSAKTRLALATGKPGSTSEVDSGFPLPLYSYKLLPEGPPI